MSFTVIKQKGDWQLIESVQATQRSIPGCNCPKGVLVVHKKFWIVKRGPLEVARFSSKQQALLFWKRRVDAK